MYLTTLRSRGTINNRGKERLITDVNSILEREKEFIIE